LLERLDPLMFALGERRELLQGLLCELEVLGRELLQGVLRELEVKLLRVHLKVPGQPLRTPS